MAAVWFHTRNTIPAAGWVFVFGSDEAGRHRRAAARIAKTNFRAAYGIAEGPTGEAYAIPVRDRHQNPLLVDRVIAGVARFIQYAASNPGQSFFVSDLSADSAAASELQVMRCFVYCPPNCSLPEHWRARIQEAQQCSR